MFSAKDTRQKIDSRVYNVGIYVRLSRDDGKKFRNQSESIKNQKEFLTRYIIEKGWNLSAIYSDDGYTGTNFERPDFKHMINDIEDKKVNLIVTKDLSRLGRDFIGMGHYILRYFPEKNVRYIAVNDEIDTFCDSITNDYLSFKLSYNDMYPKDTSRKVKNIFASKVINGAFIGAFAPYGYFKDANNKNKLVVDMETAPVVKRIFELYLDGYGYKKIANILAAEGIPCPSVYKSLISNYKNPKTLYGAWAQDTIKNILINPTYCGNLTQHKFCTVNYKLDKLKSVPKQEWVTVENTHEPIVSKNDFDLVQKRLSSNPVYLHTEGKHTHLLAGLLFCGDCGHRLTFGSRSNGSTFCLCSNYKRFGNCTRHSINENILGQFVLNELTKISRYSLEHESLIRVAQSIEITSKLNELETTISKIKRELEQSKKFIASLHEDKVRGLIDEVYFVEQFEEYAKKRDMLKIVLTEVESRRQSSMSLQDQSGYLLKLIKNFTNFKSVDNRIMRELINKIEFFENNKIKIYFKFKKPC